MLVLVFHCIEWKDSYIGIKSQINASNALFFFLLSEIISNDSLDIKTSNMNLNINNADEIEFRMFVYTIHSFISQCFFFIFSTPPKTWRILFPIPDMHTYKNWKKNAFWMIIHFKLNSMPLKTIEKLYFGYLLKLTLMAYARFCKMRGMVESVSTLLRLISCTCQIFFTFISVISNIRSQANAKSI